MLKTAGKRKKLFWNLWKRLKMKFWWKQTNFRFHTENGWKTFWTLKTKKILLRNLKTVFFLGVLEFFEKFFLLCVSDFEKSFTMRFKIWKICWNFSKRFLKKYFLPITNCIHYILQFLIKLYTFFKFGIWMFWSENHMLVSPFSHLYTFIFIL